jgi:hypothetical protein
MSLHSPVVLEEHLTNQSLVTERGDVLAILCIDSFILMEIKKDVSP